MKKVLFFVVSALITSSCSQAPQELLSREYEALKQNVDQKQALYRPITGQYEGTLTFERNGEKADAVLNILSTILTVQNPGRNDVSQLPTLAGGLDLRIPAEHSGAAPDLLSIATYTNGDYDSSTGRLILSGSVQNASAGTILVHLEGSISGNSLTAVIQTSSRRIGTIEMTRTEIPADQESGLNAK